MEEEQLQEKETGGGGNTQSAGEPKREYEKLGIRETLFGNGGWKSWLLIPLCLLLCLGLYYAAVELSRIRFNSAIEAVNERETTTRTDMTYYNRLTAREQMIWDAVHDAAKDHDHLTPILPFPPTEEEFENAMNAVFCDLPEYFCLDITDCVLETSEHTGAVELAYLDGGENGHAALQGVIGAMVSEAKTAGDEYAAALALHDALTEKSTVAGDGASGCGNAYAALAGGTADSFGYAAAYKLLCREAGIDCDIVLGTVNGVPHAWNCVTADGKTGYTDVMWDDCQIDEVLLPFHGYYFLTYAEMAKDHSADAPALWQAGDAGYDFYTYTGRTSTEDEPLSAVLERLLREARASEVGDIELLLPTDMEDYELESALHAAIAVVNADEESGGVRLRTVNRIYHASDTRPACTVQLFYEENG
ncbi:MAG: hypothetical protein MJ175_12435 [Clostridia bacterium]|nr:hypothetical protein [Clostridia bacterium]